jgi:hypothetical protein
MPSSPAPAGAPGGVLHLEYSNASAAASHSLHLHICHFDPNAIGGTHDRAYSSDGLVTPSESYVSETFDAFAALWQAYYDSDWMLRCEGLYLWQAGGVVELLSPAPDFPVQVGTNTDDDPAWPRFDRRFRLLGQKGAVRHLHLSQVPGTQHRALAFEVSATSGGLDARDRALIAYLSGASGGGIVTQDGTYCFGVTDMVVWWARSVQSLGSSAPGSPYVVTG